MERRRLGTSDISVSIIGLGTWPMGGDNWGPVDDSESIRTIHQALELGINLIDTAPSYGVGRAEAVVGRALRERRDGVVIATKCGLGPSGPDLRPDQIRVELENSLKRLRTDVIDLYQIHWPNPQMVLEDTLAEMLIMKDEGKIRAIGVSNFSAQQIRQAATFAQVASHQPHYSLLGRQIEHQILPTCIDLGIGTLAYGALVGGLLTGKYDKRPTFNEKDARSFFYRFNHPLVWQQMCHVVDNVCRVGKAHNATAGQVALAWVVQQKGVTAALVGARSPDQLRENAGAAGVRLTPDDLQLLRSLW